MSSADQDTTAAASPTSVRVEREHPMLRTVIVVSAAIVLSAGALWVLARGISYVSEALIPIGFAILFTAVLLPIQIFFNHVLRFPRHLAAAVTLLLAVGVLAGSLALAGNSLVEGVMAIPGLTSTGLNDLERMVLNSQFIRDKAQLTAIINESQQWVYENSGRLTEGVLAFSGQLARGAAGLALTLFATFFFLAEGDRLWSWTVLTFPMKYRERLHQAFRRGWVTLGAYVRTQVVVAAVDAIGIGIGMWFLDVPLIVPLVVLTFVLCFIPIVGAIVSGILVILVALITQGVTAAIILLIIVLVVQQVESHVLYPLLIGKAVNLHPLAITFSVATASYLMGFAGALFAVPFLALFNSVSAYLRGFDPFPGLRDADASVMSSSMRSLTEGAHVLKLPSKFGQANPAWCVAQQEAAKAELPEDVAAQVVPMGQVEDDTADPATSDVTEGTVVVDARQPVASGEASDDTLITRPRNSQ